MDSTTLAICESCKKTKASGDFLSEILLCDQCDYRKKYPKSRARTGNAFRATITFVRHSQSCANLMKATWGKNPLHRSWTYSDPELSGRGLAMVKDKATSFSIPNAIYGSSILYRAQQTIQHLTGGSKQYLIFPFVGEEGITEDNKPAEPGAYKLEPPSIIDTAKHHSQLYETTKNASSAKIQTFLEWLGENKELVLQYNKRVGGEEPEDPNNITLVIVSHGHNMQSFAKSQGNPHKFGNLDEMEVTVEYVDGKINGRPTVTIKPPYTPSSTLPAGCPEYTDTCRKKDVCKDMLPAWFTRMDDGQKYLIHNLLSMNIQSPNAPTKDEVVNSAIANYGTLKTLYYRAPDVLKSIYQSKMDLIVSETNKYYGENIRPRLRVNEALRILGIPNYTENEFIITNIYLTEFEKANAVTNDAAKVVRKAQLRAAYDLLSNAFNFPQGGPLDTTKIGSAKSEQEYYTELKNKGVILDDRTRERLLDLSNAISRKINEINADGGKTDAVKQTEIKTLRDVLGKLKTKVGLKLSLPTAGSSATTTKSPRRRRATRRAARRGRKTRRYR